MPELQQGACAPSALFGGAVVCVDRRQASPSPQVATVQTVERMCELVLASRDGLATRATAAGLREESAAASSISASGSAAIIAGNDERRRRRSPGMTSGPGSSIAGSSELPRAVRRCHAVWWWLRRSMRFVHDQEALAHLLNLGDDLELLIQPELIFRMPRPAGDCDDYTMAACALSLNLGLEAEIVIMAVDPAEPWRWSHVFAQAVLPCGRRFPLDATPHAEYPGWIIPAWRVNKVQEWGLDGSPIRSGAYRSFHVRRSRSIA